MKLVQKRLVDFHGIGPKISQRLSHQLGGEDRAIEIISSRDVESLESIGIPLERSLNLIRKALGWEELKLLGTQDCLKIYHRLLKLISEFAITSKAKRKLLLMMPSRDPELIKSKISRAIKLKQFLEEISPEDLSQMESWLRQAIPQKISPLLEIQYATDDESILRELAELKPKLIHDPSQLDPYLGLIVFISRNRYSKLPSNVIQLNPDSTKNYCPELKLKHYLENSQIYRAVFQIRSVLERYSSNPIASEFLDKLDPEKLSRLNELIQKFDSRMKIKPGVDSKLDSLSHEYSQLRSELPAKFEELRQAISRYPWRSSQILSEFLESLGIYSQLEFRDLSELELLVDAYKKGEYLRREYQLKLQILDQLESSWVDPELIYELDMEMALGKFCSRYKLNPQQISEDPTIYFEGARNIFLEEAGVRVQPVDYVLGKPPPWIEGVGDDRVVLLTGANSGGKTTLLETLLSLVLLTHLGLPVPASKSQIWIPDQLIYHRRHSSLKAGTLESCLGRLIPKIVSPGRKLVLIDEFEALTEPGAAARILGGLINLLQRYPCLAVIVTHLSHEILASAGVSVRVDGIFASGLDQDLNLIVDRQPKFGKMGRSTPELVIKRLIAKSKQDQVREAFQIIGSFLESRGVVGH